MDRSKRNERVWASLLCIAGFAGFLGVVNRLATPELSIAAGSSQEDTPPPGCPPNCSESPPKQSIIFVIDPSVSMYPPFGDDYFELAKQGIADFLSRPSVPADGELEVGIVQLGDRYAATSTEDVHWTRPRQLFPEVTDWLIRMASRLEPQGRLSASLMGTGIDHATALLDTMSEGVRGHTEFHIVLLTAGEDRFSKLQRTGTPPDSCTDCASPIASSDWNSASNCSRECAIRFLADEARAKGYRVSAVRVVDLDDLDPLH